jgi:hypothetical protein
MKKKSNGKVKGKIPLKNSIPTKSLKAIMENALPKLWRNEEIENK